MKLWDESVIALRLREIPRVPTEGRLQLSCGPGIWQSRHHAASDTEYFESLQATPVYELGRFDNYIAPPLRGINQKPLDFEYVRTEL